MISDLVSNVFCMLHYTHWPILESAFDFIIIKYWDVIWLCFLIVSFGNYLYRKKRGKKLSTYLVPDTELDTLSSYFILRQHWVPNTSCQLELSHSYSIYIGQVHFGHLSILLSQRHATLPLGNLDQCQSKINLWNNYIASPGSLLEIHHFRIHPVPTELESIFLILFPGGQQAHRREALFQMLVD